MQTAEAKPAKVGSIAAARPLRRRLHRPLVRNDQGAPGRQGPEPSTSRTRRGMEGPLTHYQYDTFKTNPSLKWVEPAYVTFSIGADGKVDRVTMKPVSPTADFSWDYQDLLFTPVAAAK